MQLQKQALETAAIMLRAIARGESYTSGQYWDTLLQIEAVAGIEKLARIKTYLWERTQVEPELMTSGEHQQSCNLLIDCHNQLYGRFKALARMEAA